MENILAGRMESRFAIPCILGLGYMGLPLAIEMVKASLDASRVDSSQGNVEVLRSGESYLHDVRESIWAIAWSVAW